MTFFELAKIMWEARVRYAWGRAAEAMIARDPWKSHANHPDISEAHLICIAEAKAALKALGEVDARGH